MQQTIQTNHRYKKQHLQKNQKTPNAAQHHQQRPLHIKNKITTTTGATIVFALAVFIIAAIMSMVIVNAALNNVQRLDAEPAEEQAKLAAESAMHYLADAYFGGLVDGNKSLPATGTEIKVSVTDTTGTEFGDKLDSKIIFAEGSSLSGSVTATITAPYKVDGADRAYSLKAIYQKDTADATGQTWTISSAGPTATPGE